VEPPAGHSKARFRGQAPDIIPTQLLGAKMCIALAHLEMEEALTGWLRSEITRIEQQLAKWTDPLLEARVEFSKLAEA